MRIIFGSRIAHYLARVSVFLITAALIAGMAGCGGDGSQNLEIQDWYDLDAVRDNLAGSHILMNDLDSTTPGYTEMASPTANGEQGWQPIGGLDIEFNGAFNGQGYDIRDLCIHRPDEFNPVGIFSRLGLEGVVQNVGVVDADVTGNWGVGGLVGINEGTVNNSYSTGSVTGASRVGGLVGLNEEGAVSNSYSTGNVTGDDQVGGLVGLNYDTIDNSYSTANVTGNEDVGGLAGYQSGTVSNSYYNYDEALINSESIITIGALFGEDFEQWLASDKLLDVNDRLSQEDGYYAINNVSDFKQLLAFGQNGALKFKLTSDLDLGGEPNFYIPYLAGEFDGNGHKISNLSFNFDFVSPVGLFGYLAPGGNVAELGVENVNIAGVSSAGGLVGWNVEGTVSNSYSTGSVTGNDGLGGLVGYSSGTVSNSYSTGSVTGDEFVGGLVGVNAGGVNNSFSTGSVTGNLDVGGLIGHNASGTVSNSFWDIKSSGQATSDGGSGKNTTEMQDIATFSGATWDIIAVANPSTRNPAYIWNIVDNGTYPFLSWQPV